MTSEEQYYSAKIFLNSYRDALNTLEYLSPHAAKSPPTGKPSPEHMRSNNISSTQSIPQQ